MTIRNFQFLLQPRSVALIGAGTRAGSVGLITSRNLLRGAAATALLHRSRWRRPWRAAS